jgi:hypothetical protein
MAKLNVGQLQQQVETLLGQLTLTRKANDFQCNLRRIENLTETNFQMFLAEQVNGLEVIGGSLYFPVGTGLTKNVIGNGRFARQC